MRPQPPWGRILDLVGVLAFGFALVGVVFAFTRGAWTGTAVLALVAAALVLWLWERRRREVRAAYGIAICCAVLLLIPGTDSWPTLLLFASLALIGLEGGLRCALLVAAAFGGLIAVGMALAFHRGAVDIVVQSLGTAAMLAIGGALGALVRELEVARAATAGREAELRAANEALRASITTERELVLAQERARSARELHDGLGHRLTLVAMSLQFAQRARHRDPDRAWAEIDTAAATNQQALDLMRLWARALNPPKPDTAVGGAATFEAIADAFRGTGLAVDIRHHGAPDTLPGPIAVFATRLIQEGLTNVLRHAQARRVVVDIVQSPAQVRFTVTDDGHGASAVHEGFGLRSLRERATALGGRLTTGPAVTGGWEISVVLPLPAQVGT